MAQNAIFGPVLAMVALTFVVWVYMYARRIRFITQNGILPEDLAAPGALAEMSPPQVSNPSDNLKNLFEMPVLFYALAFYLFAAGKVDTVDVVAGWVFVAFRTLHSAVHCTVNIVMLRFYLYLISSLAVWFLGGRILFGIVVG
ncbi:MAG: MAPEG family protein [Proteobacteria bacterium]|nr:MAPEG family protein [Pseudomonadota bacterium]